MTYEMHVKRKSYGNKTSPISQGLYMDFPQISTRQTKVYTDKGQIEIK